MAYNLSIMRRVRAETDRLPLSVYSVEKFS
jgi:hypothetical protein